MKLLHKMSVMLVLALFVLSVLPAGLADETEVDRNEVNDDGDDDKKDKAVKSKTEGKGKKNPSKELKREIKLVQKEAKEKYEKSKEQFKEAREKQKEHQEKLLGLNKAVKSCDAESENCTALKSELRLGVKNHLEKTVQVVERSLEKLRNKIGGIEDLSEEEKEHAITLIAEIELELDVIKLKIEGFTAETPKEEISATIKELKELTQKVNQLQRRMVGLLVNAKLRTLVEKHLDLHDVMQERIDHLAEQGADVIALTEILAEFDVEVEELQTDFEIAQEMWMNIDVTDDFDTFNRELRKAQHEVRKDLLETRESLRDFVAAYKKIAAGLNAENETEEPEEEEAPENETSELPVNESEMPSAPVNESEGTPELPVNETAGNESTETGEVNSSIEVNETETGAEAELNVGVQV